MTTLDYPASLPCPLKSTSSSPGNTFIQTEFDYEVRQRATLCSVYHLKVSFFILKDSSMTDFRKFYYDTLNNGALPFNADWIVEGSTVPKVFRFAAPYIASATKDGHYTVSATIEMLTKIKDI